MKSLYLRIYATVVVVLLLFAFGSSIVVRNYVDSERARFIETATGERVAAWTELLERALPRADEPVELQSAAVREWSQRLRVPLALEDANGGPIGASEGFLRLRQQGLQPHVQKMTDGRALLAYRPGLLRRLEGGGTRRPPDGAAQRDAGERVASGSEPGGPVAARLRPPPAWPFHIPGLPPGAALVILLVVLFLAVAAGAYPVVRRLTRRLEALKQGVEQFGSGALGHRVAVSGDDEVAAVAASFNTAAARVEALVAAHRSLLANASHELRSPLARMKMAVEMLDDAPPARRETLKREIDANVAELDALVEEVLLASRLDATQDPLQRERFDLVALVAEEASRVGASVDAPAPVAAQGDERLVRRAVRNLLENARRYGGGTVDVQVAAGASANEVHVDDRGPGVPEPLRERIFEPFYRLPGHAEQAGGVGLGLSLVKQIAARHGGSIRVAARDGGGSRFTLALPSP